MEKSKSNFILYILAFMAITVFNFLYSPGFTFADKVKSTTKINHRPIKYFVPAHRIKLEARIRDTEGINIVRCYFKAVGQADYVFVEMNKTAGNKYTGILPAPSRYTEAIEYLFLAVNGINQIVKTRVLNIDICTTNSLPKWQDIKMEGKIQVYTEVAHVPQAPQGFADNITICVVELSTPRNNS